MIVDVIVSCVALVSLYFLSMCIYNIYWDLYDIITGEDNRRK